MCGCVCVDEITQVCAHARVVASVRVHTCAMCVYVYVCVCVCVHKHACVCMPTWLLSVGKNSMDR
jgi:hypothetical protein